MRPVEIPDKLRNFIFEYIDSVEVIEILLFLFERNQEAWTALDISKELRSNPASVENRLAILNSLGLVRLADESRDAFRYSPKTPELDEIVHLLAQENKMRRHKLYEIVFSPSKQARPLAEAFLMRKEIKKGDKDG